MQLESKKCQDQMGMKNDRNNNKTRWELLPLDCLEDMARVLTEGAKKYDDNSWQNLENGYERYKGALLRHLYAAENETFDEDTGCRHLAQVAINAIFMLWISKHRQEAQLSIEDIEKQKKIEDFNIVLDNIEDVIKADCDNLRKKMGWVYEYEWNNKAINKAVKNSGLSDVCITYEKVFDAELSKNEYVYTLYAKDIYPIRKYTTNDDNTIIDETVYETKYIAEYNLYRSQLLSFLNSYKENKDKLDYARFITTTKHTGVPRNGNKSKIGSDSVESTDNVSISETDSKGHE